MQIDPSQPIMFDNDTMPGLGAGYWQVNPFAATHREDAGEMIGADGDSSVSPRAVKLMAAAIVTVAAGFVVIGGVSTFLF
jgi:hypothetical protein